MTSSSSLSDGDTENEKDLNTRLEKEKRPGESPGARRKGCVQEPERGSV